MKTGEFGVALAHFIRKAQLPAHVAVIHNKNRVLAAKSSLRTHLHDCRTAIVNLMQAASGSAARDSTVFSTQIPTEMDLGMMKMRRVREIYYVDGGNIQRLGINDNALLSNAAVVGTTVNTGVYLPELPNDWSGKSDLTRTDQAHTYFGTVTSHPLAHRANNCPDDATKVLWKAATGNIGMEIPNAVPDPFLEDLSSLKSITVDRDSVPASVAKLVDHIYMLGAYSLVEGAIERNVVSIAKGHSIGCLLVQKDGTIAGWGVNTGAGTHGTRHGEVNMLQAWLDKNQGKGLPKDSRIYTTLQPCHMCAGMICRVGGNRNVEVIFGQDDPNIVNAALARNVDGCSERELFGTLAGTLSREDLEKLLPGLKNSQVASDLEKGDLEQLTVPFLLESRLAYNRGARNRGPSSTTGTLNSSFGSQVFDSALARFIALGTELEDLPGMVVDPFDAKTRYARIMGEWVDIPSVVILRRVWFHVTDFLRMSVYRTFSF